MERATEPSPDPEITGHLGDAYWPSAGTTRPGSNGGCAAPSDDAEERAMLDDRLANGVPAADTPGAK